MYGESTLIAVREQLQRVTDHDFYAKKFEKAGVDPGALDSWEEFNALPPPQTETLI
jgi:phenylacetate-coenzyme A ligase PaaK-like adenylate-forming protein